MMPLIPIPTVPHVIGADVQGMDGTRAWLDLPDPRDRLTLWAVGRDMAPVYLDLAGVLALQALLGEVAAAMGGGQGGLMAPGAACVDGSARGGAKPAIQAGSANGAPQEKQAAQVARR